MGKKATETKKKVCFNCKTGWHDFCTGMGWTSDGSCVCLSKDGCTKKNKKKGL